MVQSANSFELFCWYYLGVSPMGEYRFVNGNQVAQIYNCSVGELMTQLQKHSIDPDTVLNTDFPIARYQVDVQMAAERFDGEQLLDFAGRIFTDFKQRIGHRRDWAAEIEREKEEDRRKGS